ncbi:unnamed protein product [Fusarium graminearum]|nr:unnamed protein product [Fusarium graminearum]CAF3623995.1 unnamed protein product [Fusarium graminearum]
MASIYLLDQTSDRPGQTKPVFVYEIRAEDYLIETHKIRVRDTKNAMTSACDDGLRDGNILSCLSPAGLVHIRRRHFAAGADPSDLALQSLMMKS